MNVKYFALVILLTALYSCNNSKTQIANKIADTGNTSSAKIAVKPMQDSTNAEIADSVRHAKLNRLVIANENDPVCDMSMMRGFEDTTVYKGKLIGFCSKECKDEFVKKPKAYKIKYK